MTGSPIKYGEHERIPAGTPCEVCADVHHRPVMDHCHQHGWARGVLCPRCNAGMSSIDRGLIPGRGSAGWIADVEGLIHHAAKCPDCTPVDADALLIPGSKFVRRILVSLPDEVHDRLKAAADADRRSVNSELVVAIEAFLDGRDKIAHLIEED